MDVTCASLAQVRATGAPVGVDAGGGAGDEGVGR